MSALAWLSVALSVVGVLAAANYRALRRAFRVHRGDDDR